MRAQRIKKIFLLKNQNKYIGKKSQNMKYNFIYFYFKIKSFKKK